MFFPKTESKSKRDMITTRNAAVAKAEAALNAAQSANREMTAAENEEYESAMAEARQLNLELNAYQSRHSLRPVARPSENGLENPADKRFKFAGLAQFLESGDGGVRASLTEGADLQYILPSYEVLAFLHAYSSVDPFTQAGASITNLEGPWSDSRVPILTSGDEPSSYAEGDGPDTDQPAHVYTARLTNPSKYAFLCKPSEESLEDIESLAGSLAQEGVRRVINKATKAVTAALLTSLASASATVAGSGGDNLEDLLNMIAAIPSFFASNTNAWMLNRKTLALLRNTRVGSDSMPAFNPTTNQILGYNAVLNDYVGNGKLLFGDFRSAVYWRRGAFHFQQLDQAYRESGQIGLRFYQRSQAAFFSDAANNSQSEQPVYLLTSDFGS